MRPLLLIHPKALLITEDGTFIIAPRHDDQCRAGRTLPVTPPRCPGCLYHHLVDQLLELAEYDIVPEAGIEEAKRHAPK